MPRYLLAAVVAAAACGALGAPARAGVEFCPARVAAGLHAFAPTKSGAASLYSFMLSGEAPRAVDGALDVQAKEGWFQIPFPKVVLAPRELAYADAYASWKRPTFLSPVLYARFAHAIHIERVWVGEARAYPALGGGAGWAAEGRVACDPTSIVAVASAPQHSGFGWSPKTVMAIDKRLAMRPKKGDPVVAGQSTAALEKTHCRIPFRPAKALKAVAPRFPMGYRNMSAPLLVLVRVSIDHTGKLLGTSVWGSSGVAAFDDAAVDAARASRYQPGTAFCRPVAGSYLFVSQFLPRPQS
ncbi:MAG: TonB family protein [Vulcanimicrobiaceae bacterium]